MLVLSNKLKHRLSHSQFLKVITECMLDVETNNHTYYTLYYDLPVLGTACAAPPVSGVIARAPVLGSAPAPG